MVINALYLLVTDCKETIQGSLQLTGIISKLYGSRSLVVSVVDSVCLIPLQDIRPVYILNVWSYSLGEYVLL